MEKFSLNAQTVVVYLKLTKKSVTKIGQSTVFLGRINVLNVKISANLIRVAEKRNKLKVKPKRLDFFYIL